MFLVELGQDTSTVANVDSGWIAVVPSNTAASVRVGHNRGADALSSILALGISFDSQTTCTECENAYEAAQEADEDYARALAQQAIAGAAVVAACGTMTPACLAAMASFAVASEAAADAEGDAQSAWDNYDECYYDNCSASGGGSTGGGGDGDGGGGGR